MLKELTMKIRPHQLTRSFPDLRVLAIFTSLMLVNVVSFGGCHQPSVTGGKQVAPEDALKRFYDHDGPEDSLMDPLILAGDSVVPLVLKEVMNKNMPRRRYAIAFLGNGSYKDALPVLEPILQDPVEADYIRGDALQSIFLIDATRGARFAHIYKDQTDYLGDVSRRIISGDSQLKKIRTYSDALQGKHE